MKGAPEPVTLDEIYRGFFTFSLRVRELEVCLSEKDRQLELQRDQISSLKQQCAFYERVGVGGDDGIPQQQEPPPPPTAKRRRTEEQRRHHGATGESQKHLDQHQHHPVENGSAGDPAASGTRKQELQYTLIGMVISSSVFDT